MDSSCSADWPADCGDDVCALGHDEGLNYDRSACYVANNKYKPIVGCGAVCTPTIPPGCDCWGCCTVCVDNECVNIYTSPQVSPDCTEDTFLDPSKCYRCEQDEETVASCPSECDGGCGDGLCGDGETYATCAVDCAATCGDTVCDASESTADCPADCGTSCGDGVCHLAEVGTCTDCAPSCGDGECGLTCGTKCDPENCIICPGMTVDDLPEDCTGNTCPNGWTTCVDSSECGANEYCGFGCCVPQA